LVAGGRVLRVSNVPKQPPPEDHRANVIHSRRLEENRAVADVRGKSSAGHAEARNGEGVQKCQDALNGPPCSRHVLVLVSEAAEDVEKATTATARSTGSTPTTALIGSVAGNASAEARRRGGGLPEAKGGGIQQMAEDVEKAATDTACPATATSRISMVTPTGGQARDA
jgi:hypothetical protein